MHIRSLLASAALLALVTGCARGSFGELPPRMKTAVPATPATTSQPPPPAPATPESNAACLAAHDGLDPAHPVQGVQLSAAVYYALQQCKSDLGLDLYQNNLRTRGVVAP